MAATYEPIATTTIGSAQSSITLSSISGSYTDLILVAVGDQAASFDGINVTVNSDTASNYSDTILNGNGSVAGSSRDTSATAMNLGLAQAAGQAINIMQFMNYSNTTTYKTVLSRANSVNGAATRAVVGLWRSTSAITSITLTRGGTNSFNTGYTVTLYGIKAA